MNEQFLIQAKAAPENGYDITLNNGVHYSIFCQLFHCDDEGKEIGKRIILSPILLNSITINDSIFLHYREITLSYHSAFDAFIGWSDSRLNDESKDSTGPVEYSNFVYLGGGRDRIHISFYSKNETLSDQPYYSQNAIIDDDFVIMNKAESSVDQINDTNNRTLVTLTLVPVAMYDLMTTFPQWTTGFDKWLADGSAEEDKKHDLKSGVSTGICIKELLEKCKKELFIDDIYGFDEGIAKINFTSILNNSAFDSICKIFDFHFSSFGPCIFKWNEFLQKFQLRPIKQFFDYLISDSLNLLSISHKKNLDEDMAIDILSLPPIHSNITFITENLDKYLFDELQCSPKIQVSRHKSTFCLNFDQYKDEENILQNDSSFFGDWSSTQMNFAYNKPLLCGMGRSSFTPHYRTGERNALNCQQIARFFNSFGVAYTRPGLDGRFESGRLFNVNSIDGAKQEVDRQIDGLYLMTFVVSNISFSDSTYTCEIVGFKNKQAEKGKFKIGDEAPKVQSQFVDL